MREQSVLITGGAGFIGRWVARRYVDRGSRVVVYDNLAVGRRDNLAEFADRVKLVEGDVVDARSFEQLLDAERPRVVFHLAALHFIPYCNAHPEEALRVNVSGTFAVLAACASRSIDVAFASSGVLYPDREGPLDEEGETETSDVYSLSKALGEQIAFHFGRDTGRRTIVARLFNTFGPYETNPHVIPHIIGELKAGNRIRLGNIATMRDYVYVEDVAEMLVAAVECAPPGHFVVNIGSGREHTVAEVVEEIGVLLGRQLEVERDMSRVRATDKQRQLADLGRLERLVGRAPQRSLREGLASLLRHEGLL
jgi:UDP-glucose 4-epimerase